MAKDKKEFSEQLMGKITALIFDTHREILQNTPVQTGRLRSSIVIEKEGDGWIIGTPVEYAEYVELGTPPHIIVPKIKKALKFNVGGEEVFAKKVNHPGTQGSHMFLKGVNYFEANLNNI
jgi:hypothetical protein